jgi:hypothetical protein
MMGNFQEKIALYSMPNSEEFYYQIWPNDMPILEKNLVHPVQNAVFCT